MRYEDQNVLLYIEDEILVAKYKSNCIVTKEVSETAISERIKLSNHKSYKVLGDFRFVKYWTMDSRNNSMKERAYDLVSCAAIVVNSKIIRIIWGFTVRLFPMPVPNKIFKDIESAKAWLIANDFE